MQKNNIYAQLNDVIKSHHAEFRMINIDHLSRVEAEIQELNSEGLFDDGFFKERLTSFGFYPHDDFSHAKSVLIVAVPQPALIIRFMYKGSEHPVTLPPTYDQQTDRAIMESVEGILNPAGYRLKRARLPEKNLAAHSGLIRYGRNNIGYVEHMGSFHRPAAFYTNLPCEDSQWIQPEMMDRCMKCKACIKACPTGAIGEDRFLLHAERCITFHNEHLKEIPEYINPSMHHCLLGCMICQKVCPVNRDFVEWVEMREHFSEEETGCILNGMPYDNLKSDTRKKLDRLSLTEDYFLLSRNLGLLLVP